MFEEGLEFVIKKHRLRMATPKDPEEEKPPEPEVIVEPEPVRHGKPLISFSSPRKPAPLTPEEIAVKMELFKSEGLAHGLTEEELRTLALFKREPIKETRYSRRPKRDERPTGFENSNSTRTFENKVFTAENLEASSVKQSDNPNSSVSITDVEAS